MSLAHDSSCIFAFEEEDVPEAVIVKRTKESKFKCNIHNTAAGYEKKLNITLLFCINMPQVLQNIKEVNSNFILRISCKI